MPDRRSFLKRSSIAFLPAVLPAFPLNAATFSPSAANEPIVKFFGDGEFFDGAAYWEQLQQANSKQAIKVDRYGNGGVVTDLEKQFAGITGKEKAIYMPSGTMANQLAIAVLSGENTKVFVQDTSHVYRDEADAAQSIFNKRLMPLAKNETYFTAAALQQAVEGLNSEEVFKSGIGCVSVENPVRRTDERMIPLEEIKKISAYCRGNNIKLHLDGARLYMASAWSGVSIKEYASYFDTVYISLYKYLGASGGALLCGDATVIDKMPHLIKIHGGNMFGNWLNAAMALHRLDGLEQRLQEAIKTSRQVFAALNKIPGVAVTALDGGTNKYVMQFPAGLDGKKCFDYLNSKFIRIPGPNKEGKSMISVNETWLYREPAYISGAVAEAIKISK